MRGGAWRTPRSRRFLQQASDDGAADRAVAAQVEQLVARVAEAVVLQDRRDALAQLRDLLTSGGGGAAAAAFGAAGFPLALGIVRDREDRELVQLALESLSAAVGGGTDGGGTDAAASQVCAGWAIPRLPACKRRQRGPTAATAAATYTCPVPRSALLRGSRRRRR